MTRDEFMGYCRAVLAAVGGAIGSRYGDQYGTWRELSIGAGMIVAAMVWSHLSKRYKKEGQ